MKKFTLIYSSGGSVSPSSVTPSDSAKIMEEWMKWFEKLGKALIDGGFPFKENGKVLHPDGNVSDLNQDSSGGYSIIEAESIEVACELAKGCPHLKDGGLIEIYEEMPLN